MQPVRTIVVTAFALAVLAPSLPAQVSDTLVRAANTITAQDVSRHIGVIADDSMRGRATTSRGLELTAQYVAEHFKRFGLKPGGEAGSWFQQVPVEGSSTETAPNTVGILEGSDPKLKHEYIVISAHMDHIGTGWGNGLEEMRGVKPQPPNDSIYNGADDNASGTAGLIELAEAFTQPGARPRRSLIFLGTSGEEGGSDPPGAVYFIQHPPVPLEQVVANFNIDMIGRTKNDTLLVEGGHYSDLATIVGRIVPAHQELHLSPVLQAGRPPEADHAHFAEKKIPILFFFDGGAFGSLQHPDYHQVTDTPDKIAADWEARVLRLVFYVGQEVGNAEQRPKWNEQNWQHDHPSGSQP